MRYAAFTLAALALAACRSAPARNGEVSGGRRPDWVDGRSREYPQDSYITGVGMGDDRAAAEERSRGEIAKIFSATVSVETTQSESESNATGQATNFQQSIQQIVHTAAKKAMEGTEVASRWQDSATKQQYALAVLDRAKAAAAVREKLAELDKQSVEWKKTLDGSGDKLGRVKAALKVLALLRARGELSSELRVITGRGAESGPVDEAATKQLAAKAISELDVAVDMTGEASQQIETGIVSGLNDFGLPAKVGRPGDADVAVEGQVKTDVQRAADESDKWKWSRATVTIALKDRAGKTFARFDQTSRQASADQGEAARRVHVDLAKKVSASVKDAVTSYFENQ